MKKFTSIIIITETMNPNIFNNNILQATEEIISIELIKVSANNTYFYCCYFGL